MLEIDELQVDYAGSIALRGAGLRLAEGEIVALIGANGAGKSTTLNAISGLLRPSAGAIRFRGEAIHGRSPRDIVRLGIAQVPEGRRIFGTLSIQDNLLTGALGRSRAEVRESLDDVYGLFPELLAMRRRAGGALSGGQQQMLAVGRALMLRPQVLLLDEPSLGLAPVVVDRVSHLVRALRARGISILLVEQNAALALELSDRAYVLERGSVVAKGDSRHLATLPVIREAFLGLVPQDP